MLARLRKEEAFGMIELVMAMLILSIGIMGILAAFTSGSTAIRRASQVATASALADAELERYRALRYDSIALDPGSSQSVTGPDARTYRIDTSIILNTPPSGREGKRVAIVVLDVLVTPPQTLVRVESTFDRATG